MGAAGDRAGGRYGGRGARRELPEELRDGMGWWWRVRVAPRRGRDRRLADGRAPPPARCRDLARWRRGGARIGRSIPGFDLHAGSRLARGTSRASVGTGPPPGLSLRAENVDAFREAFAAHAAKCLGPDDLKRTERIDAMVGGVGLGLELAEELGQLAPFGMGNPGVRLMVPSARVSDVRTMGEEASTRGSACTAVRTVRSASPSAARAWRRRRRAGSTPRSGSRSTTGTARSSPGWC